MLGEKWGRSENSQTRRMGRALLAAAALGLLGGGSCGKGGGNSLPAVGTASYNQVTNVFFSSVAALRAGDNARINSLVPQVTKLASDEPAGWANAGLVALRSNQYEVAAQNLKKAQELAPNNSRIETLLGTLASKQGKYADAITLFKSAWEHDPNNLRAAFALVQELTRQSDPASETEAQDILLKLVQAHPENLSLQIELLRLAAKRNDSAAGQTAIGLLDKRQDTWPASVKEIFQPLKSVARNTTARFPVTSVMQLQNVLRPLPAYRQGYAALTTPNSAVGEPVEEFLKLPNPPRTPAAPDMALTLNPQPVASSASSAASKTMWQVLKAEVLTPELPSSVATNHRLPAAPESPVSLLMANGKTVQIETPSPTGIKPISLPFPGGSGATSPSHAGIVVMDWSYDFRMDLVLAGAGGLKLYKQSANGTFTDETTKAHLPASITGAPLYGAWAADVDMDGDLDIVLAPVSGSPQVLRNNGDGTFSPMKLFSSVSRLRDFAWCDIDEDGDPDAALLDADGKLHIFINERSGIFRERPVPASLGEVAALTVADANNDGALDFVLLKADGAIVRLSDKDEGADWTVAELARWSLTLRHSLGPGDARLFAADLDNNGSTDLVASTVGTSQVFLSDAQAAFKPLPAPLEAGVFALADRNLDGRIDAVGLSDQGGVIQAVNQGTKNYHWQVLRPRAAHVVRETRVAGQGGGGDSRINTFGIGGEAEVRAGLLVQKQPITGPYVHFGLGENTESTVTRYIWPNGAFQAEFELKADTYVVTSQRLIGSCPWLFAHDGTGMKFVTDFIWRSPLGLRINAQDTAGVMATEDWVKIRGDQLAPKDGYYDIRITAELWETHFFDHVSLLVVDHPKDSAVYVDERFAFPPPKPQVNVVTLPLPIKRALDDRGQDVTEVVRDRDGKYLDTFDLGQYQGVTRDHYMEVEVPEGAPRVGPLYLLAYGWIHPTDSSINVALSQGKHPAPQGLRLEVSDGKGGWTVANKNLGFPEGKNKTILIPLEGVFKSLPAGAPRRVRLRTNLEVYWDQIQVAVGRPNTSIKIQRLQPETADLHFRGFSATHTPNSSSPELPDYDTIQATNQQWRDLIGWYTRYGDVKELLKTVDDRYVIMNAGDEMSFRFAAPPLPQSGWVRDYVLIGDGWEKDGNLNTTFSKTVLPLPSHNDPKYNTPPGRLQDDPVYRRYPQDWVNYHTRFVAPDEFKRGLR